MKLSNIKYIMMAMLVAFASCSKEEKALDVSVEGDLVNFGSLSTIADDSYNEIDTKVEYGDLNSTTNKWVLKWNEGDKVNITRHGTTSQSVNYSITPTGDGTVGKLTADDGAESLKWSGGSSDVFSIVYPHTATVTQNAVEISYKMNNPINAVINGEAAVDMTNFRMLNFQSVNKTSNNVNLISVPATTTLDITIKGPASGYLPVSRVVIAIKNTKKYISKDGKVKFKYNNGTVEYETYSDAPEVLSFVYYITNNSGFVDLYSGNSIKFKAFIPGIPYEPGDYTVTVNNGVSGKLYTPQTKLPKSVRHPLNITTVKGDDSGWIGDLPDDMKVMDMNIPGSYYCNSFDYGAPGSDPIAQMLDIPNQWLHGIRVFYTPCDYSGSNVVTCCRGTGVGTRRYKKNGVLTTTLLDKLVNMLEKQPREFAIVITPYSKTNYSYYDTYVSTYDNQLGSYVQANKNKFYVGDFDSNTKIEDLRGKIVLIHESKSTSIGPILKGWIEYDGQKTTTPQTHITIDGQTISIASVDEGYYANLIALQCKQLVENNFAKSGLWRITDIASHTPNRVKADYITGSTHTVVPLDGSNGTLFSIKYTNNVGIVLISYVGSRALEGANSGGSARDVYGDVLPQIIINKNFFK